MDLIQNPVLNREGKKWKQRWAVLKKSTPKSSYSSSEFVCYLYLYKDASHAKEGKEKCVLPLDFCGLEVSNQFDKANNVLVVITLSQTVYLSFDQRSVLDKWHHILTEHFGQAVRYDVSIPDKQKLKSGEATLRLYQSFFSIVTNKHFRCLNRWYISDIHNYSALDNSHFMFEVTLAVKSKGFVVNLLVPHNAEDVAKAFDGLVGQKDSSSLTTHNHFHGSAILDELGQAKRNVGDQSFFRRVILRASNLKMRKKHRRRAQTAESGKKKNVSSPMLEEAKYRSLDRRKSPDLSVELNDVSALKVLQIARSKSEVSYSRKESENDTLAPELPKKKTSNANNVAYKVQLNDKSTSDKKIPERSLLKPRSMTTNDIPTVTNGQKLNTSRSANDVTETDGVDKDTNTVESVESASTAEEKVNLQPSDRSDIMTRQVRTSADSYTSSAYPTKHPAKYYIEKTKRTNKDGQKTPTPPPRSPVSLGLQPNMFVYPSNENINEEDKDGSLLDEIDTQLKRNTIHSDVSDDAFIESGGEPSPDVTNNNVSLYNPNEPIYGNMNAVRNSSDSNTLTIHQDVIRRKNFHRNSTKHLSDPLMVDNWAEATGDGKVVSSLGHIPKTDYVNVKGTSMSDDENDSYVNVSGTSGQAGRKKHKPQPLRIKNDFNKYDDDDDVYHALAGVDGNTSNSLDAINQGNGSYENVNATRRADPRKGSEYLNLPMSPSSAPTSRSTSNSSSLNYIMVGGKADIYPPGYKSGSPVRQNARSPADAYIQSNYILIDESATSALKRSVDEHQRKSPTKTAK